MLTVTDEASLAIVIDSGTFPVFVRVTPNLSWS